MFSNHVLQIICSFCYDIVISDVALICSTTAYMCYIIFVLDEIPYTVQSLRQPFVQLFRNNLLYANHFQ